MKKYIIFLFSLVFIFCKSNSITEASSGNPSDPNQLSMDQSQLKNAGIRTGSMEKKNLSKTLRVSGIIDVPPQNNISVSAPMGGYLISTHLLPGTPVKKGEVLAVLEDQLYINLQQEFLLTKTKMALAEKEFNRQNIMYQSQATSDKNLQQSENDLQILKINLNALSEKLKIIHIDPARLSESTITSKVYLYSPIQGFVTHVHVNIGKYVNPTEVLFELVNPADIHLNLKVFEKDIPHLYINQQVISFTNHQPGKKYNGKIILLGKNISDDHTIEVHCHFNTNDKTLIPGTYMNAEIELNNHEVFSLPDEAIVFFENKNYIFIQEDTEKHKMVEVVTGIKENNYTEIIGGDKFLSNKIVIKGAYALLMALKNNEEL